MTVPLMGDRLAPPPACRVTALKFGSVGWWRRIRWPIIALVGCSLAIVFGVTAAIQRIELQDRHLHIEWGNTAEWVAGVGTFAAFGVLLVAALQWRSDQADRRDHEADQARLIIIEPVKPRNAPPNESHVVVRNHSSAPVFDLTVSSDKYVGGAVELIPVEIKPLKPARDSPHQSVLPPGKETGVFRVIGVWPGFGSIDFVTVSFTDANNRRWERQGISEPKRVLIKRVGPVFFSFASERPETSKSKGWGLRERWRGPKFRTSRWLPRG